MYFHTDNPATIGYIADVAKTAQDTGTRLRLDVDSQGNLRIKRGEGIWSPPFASTPDAYRDLGYTPDPNFGKVAQPDTDDGMTCPQCKGTDGMHYLDCDAFAWL